MDASQSCSMTWWPHRRRDWGMLHLPQPHWAARECVCPQHAQHQGQMSAPHPDKAASGAGGRTAEAGEEHHICPLPHVASLATRQLQQAGHTIRTGSTLPCPLSVWEPQGMPAAGHQDAARLQQSILLERAEAKGCSPVVILPKVDGCMMAGPHPDDGAQNEGQFLRMQQALL